MKKYVIGFIGIGAMGKFISRNLNEAFPDVRVYDKNNEISKSHSEEFRTIFCENLEDLTECNLIFTCLPRSIDVRDTYETLGPSLDSGTICVDCTSGDPFITIEIGEFLDEYSIHFLDCPVSGGPAGADAATIASMIGGDDSIANEILPIVEVFSRPSIVGKLGCGHALKSLNNLLNTTNLCVAAEGLSRLKKELDIDVSTALEVINKSSGRSLMTMERIPYHIMELDYDYGFMLELMRKDCGIAKSIVKEPSMMFSTVIDLLDEALERYGEDADYTEICRLFFDDISLK